MYAKVGRVVVVEGISQREVARRYGLDRKTVSKTVPFSIPTGYCRKALPTARKSGAFVRVIDQIVEADCSVLKKQHHTFQHVRSREMFAPAAHRAGDAQADFGQADIYLNGAKTRIYLLSPGSTAPRRKFVKTDRGETTEAFLEVMSLPLLGYKVSLNRSFTTTPRWQRRRSLAGQAPAHSHG